MKTRWMAVLSLILCLAGLQPAPVQALPAAVERLALPAAQPAASLAVPPTALQVALPAASPAVPPAVPTAALAPADIYEEDVPTLNISNEAPGRLIDALIAEGHSDETLFEVLGYLKLQSGGVISDTFYNDVYNAPAGSEVFTARVSNYAGLNGTVEISADGTVHTRSVSGSFYAAQPGYAVTPSQDGVFRLTHAQDPAHFIHTGSSEVQVGPMIYTYYYKAFAIAWRKVQAIYLPLVLK